MTLPTGLNARAFTAISFRSITKSLTLVYRPLLAFSCIGTKPRDEHTTSNTYRSRADLHCGVVHGNFYDVEVCGDTERRRVLGRDLLCKHAGKGVPVSPHTHQARTTANGWMAFPQRILLGLCRHSRSSSGTSSCSNTIAVRSAHGHGNNNTAAPEQPHLQAKCLVVLRR